MILSTLTLISMSELDIVSNGGDMVDEAKNKAKESIKEVLYSELDESAKVLIRNIISPKSLGVVIIIWVLLSVGISIYIRANNMCEMPRVQLGKYLASRLLCQEK